MPRYQPTDDDDQHVTCPETKQQGGKGLRRRQEDWKRWAADARLTNEGEYGQLEHNPQSTTKELWLQKKQSLHKEESVIEGVVMTNQGGLHTLITVA